jgi:hypothetical protein
VKPEKEKIMNVPTAPYRPVAPTAREAAPYIPWLIDKAVRVGRDYGYSTIVDQALALILSDLGVTVPVGGFVDSDGRTATGRTPSRFNAEGFNAEGLNRDGLTLDEVIEAEVEAWTTEKRAAVLTAIAGHVG